MADDLRNLSKRFSHRLHLVLISAAQLATQQGKKAIAPSHLLYGLVGQQEFLIAQFFPANGGKGTIPAVKVKTKKTAAEKAAEKQGIALTVSSQRILQHATKVANYYQHPSIDILHLFASLLHYPNPDLEKILAKKKIHPHELEGHIMAWLEDLHSLSPLIDALHPNQQEHKHEKEAARKPQSALQVFATHLTDAAYATKLDPLIGREKEISRLTTILARRTKNNPLLLGEPGVGKTAIVEGLARKILLGDVPASLQDKKIYALNLTSMVAGTTFRGELESRFKHLLDEITERTDVILFIDEIHTMVGAGGSAGSAMDVGNILKPALARGQLRCIGATTFGEYKKHIEDDPALERRFQSITVDQPSMEETERIIAGVAPYYEKFHGISITPEAIHSAVMMGHRYLPERYFPDKAIDLIDEAAAFARTSIPLPALDLSTPLTGSINTLPLLEASHIAQVVSHSTGIPLGAIVQNDKTRLRDLEAALSRHVVGQDHAKRIISQALRRAQCGLTPPGRPVASFAFLGPSGVGKTELAKAIAEEVFGPGALIKLDMSEFSESFTISRLLGAPNGYVGFKEGGKLTEAVRRKPHSIVVFDEIEKAHPKVANILLQLLEDGRLTDSAGKLVDFSNTVIILTSNLGAQFAQGQPSLGFGLTDTAGTHDATKEKLVSEMKQWFSPELVNRLDQVVVFNELTSDDLCLIIRQKLSQLQDRLSLQKITLKVTPRAHASLAKQIKEQGQGARAVRHLIEQSVEPILADALMSHSASPPHAVTLDVGPGETLTCRIKSSA